MAGIVRRWLKFFYHNSKLARYYWLKIEWARRRKAMQISDVEFAQIRFRKKTGQELNLENPVTFNDKLWYLKLSNRDPLLTKCSDKYLVREYVQECGLGHILNELYAVYYDARDIDFDNIPSPCFLKCNHASGYNAKYDRNKPFDKKDFIRRFNFALTQNYYMIAREWNYKDIRPCIICERVLEDPYSAVGIADYRFLCFGGKAKAFFIGLDTAAEDGTHSKTGRRNLYDMDFNLQDVTVNYGNFPPELVPKPDNFDKMCAYAEVLSKPFPYCRVDLYNINGKIYFSELTFYPGGASNRIKPEEWAVKLGEWIDLTGYSIAADALNTDPQR